MRLTIAVCCVVAWGGVASAEGKHFNIQGAGAMSCAKYAELYRRDPNQVDLRFLSWAQGFITCTNLTMPEAYFDLGAKEPEEMMQFLRKYCNDHPLADFVEAAMELAKSLPRLRLKDEAPAPR
jgi:hypothetical protein